MTVNEIANKVRENIVQYFETKQNKEREIKEKIVKEKDIKYPFQVGSIKRTKKVLGVDAKLSAPTDREKLSPLELHSGFSRFELTIVDKETNTTPTANIPAEDVYAILENSRIALAQVLTNKNVTGDNISATGLAYTQKLIDKNYKGLTPAEVLLKDASQETGLTNVKNWLAQNVERYPANRAQINAIDEAIKLLHEGKLSAKDINTSSSDIEIYKTDYKFKTKKNEKGYNLIYSIEITCDPAKRYPFSVTIMNCYAPVETGAGGQKTIKMTAAENTIKSTLLMDKKEWTILISKLDRVLTMFEQMNFANLFDESQIAGQYQRNNAQ